MILNAVPMLSQKNTIFEFVLWIQFTYVPLKLREVRLVDKQVPKKSYKLNFTLISEFSRYICFTNVGCDFSKWNPKHDFCK